jgi:Cof subfamily protein (haloacid dehalogenase superfamily)
MSKIKAIFTDIDHTLTSPTTGLIPKSAVEAIRQARENGIKVFVATGRNLTGDRILPIAGLSFDGYLTVNGQYCYLPDGTVLRFAPFKREWVEETIRLGREHRFVASYHQRELITVNGLDQNTERFYQVFKAPIPPFMEDEALDKDGILSIVPFVSEDMDDLLRNALPELQVVRWNPFSSDLAPKSGGKDIGVKVFCERFGLMPEECLAIGDGDNDISMLKFVGTGVAVAGARKETKAAADHIAPAVDDHAVYKTFQKFGII